MRVQILCKLVPVFVAGIVVFATQTVTANQSRLKTKVSQSKTSTPLWEVKTAPIALFASWYTLDVSYRLTPNWSTGPAVVGYNANESGNMFAPSYKGIAAGWNANYYFNTALRNSWYVSAHSYYESYDSYPHSAAKYYERDGFRVNSAFGYQARGKLINIMAGVGAEYRNHAVNEHEHPKYKGDFKDTLGEYRESGVVPFVEFKIGFEI